MPDMTGSIKEKPSIIKIIAIVAIILIGGILLYLVFNAGSDARNDNVSLSQIEQEHKDSTLVLYFWGEGCSYCVTQKGIIEDLEVDYQNTNVTFYWFNLDKNRELRNHYNIIGVPTTIVLNKTEIQNKFTGYTDYDPLSNSIDNAMETYEL